MKLFQWIKQFKFTLELESVLAAFFNSFSPETHSLLEERKQKSLKKTF